MHTVMTMDTMIMCMNKCRRVNTATLIATNRGAIRIRTCRMHIMRTATKQTDVGEAALEGGQRLTLMTTLPFACPFST